MLSPGSLFAGYRVERVLGSGGMGTVYLVQDPELPRGAALKVLDPQLSQAGEFRARFLREADLAAGLSHPNIVAVYRRGDFEGRLWIAMQLVAGIDADAALRQGSMTPARAVHIIEQVGRALDYAHQRRALHRDLKPANFLLSGPVGPDERVLLSDFGMGSGDAAYAAPEVLASRDYDRRADLYSLGCTLFRLLGNPGSGLSPRMDAVLATAMAKDPEQRFRTARELAAAAAQALDDPAVNTTAPWRRPGPEPTMAAAGYFPPPGQPPKRRGGLIFAAVVAIFVLAAAGGIAASLAKRSPRPNPPAPAASSPASSSPETSAPSGPVAGTALVTLLLSGGQVSAIMAIPGMASSDELDAALPAPYKISDQDCVGSWIPATAKVYDAAGPTGLRAQLVSSPKKDVGTVIQAVVALPDPSAAQKLVADQAASWAACSGRTITDSAGNGPPHNWIFGPLTNTGGTLSMAHSSPDQRLAVCQHAMTARNNVVADVLACKIDGTNQGVAILNAIAAKIPSP
jgi:tRNA A-37 threonylcarbamoyl transferase component Bud32